MILLPSRNLCFSHILENRFIIKTFLAVLLHTFLYYFHFPSLHFHSTEFLIADFLWFILFCLRSFSFLTLQCIMGIINDDAVWGHMTSQPHHSFFFSLRKFSRKVVVRTLALFNTSFYFCLRLFTQFSWRWLTETKERTCLKNYQLQRRNNGGQVCLKLDLQFSEIVVLVWSLSLALFPAKSTVFIRRSATKIRIKWSQTSDFTSPRWKKFWTRRYRRLWKMWSTIRWDAKLWANRCLTLSVKEWNF